MCGSMNIEFRLTVEQEVSLSRGFQHGRAFMPALPPEQGQHWPVPADAVSPLRPEIRVVRLDAREFLGKTVQPRALRMLAARCPSNIAIAFPKRARGKGLRGFRTPLGSGSASGTDCDLASARRLDHFRQAENQFRQAGRTTLF